ncbi:MAG: alpha/beta hydrolase [Rhodospirillales bacterium]|nr:alpha/beta hydrolase [Rhodospirillales bacterium]
MGRREKLGKRVIDAKAQAVGRFSQSLRIPGYIPTIEETRVQTKKIVEVFDEPSPPIKRLEDFTLQGAAGELKARLYSDSDKGETQLPVLVFFHGGGYVQGDLDTHDGICGKLAKWSGGIIISVDYRLAPEHKFPAAVDDSIAAYLWVRENAASFGGNPDKVGVGGDSAGGNLSAAISQQMILTNQRVPDFQALIYPGINGQMETASHQELKEAYIIPRDRMEWYRDTYINDLSDVADPRFSVNLNQNLQGQPTTFIVTAGFDPLRDEGIEFADALKKTGTLVTHAHYPGQIHAFVSLCKVIPQGNQCIRGTAGWLRKTWS